MIKRFRHIILIMFMALRAIYSIAQIAMPDKVCVGTNRHYWVQNVLPGSVFTWAINGATQTSTTDFIDIYWTVAGTYTLTVQEHQANCDGEVQVGMVTVSDPVVPVFAPIAPLCQNSLAPPLLTVSTNSITGSWSPNTISTATAGTTTYTFTPDDGQCATTVSMTIVVNEPIVPLFAAIGPLCKNSIAPPLLLTSINGITGTWSPSVISTAIAGSASYTFTPTAGLCASPVTITIEVIEPTVPQFALIGTLCINTIAPTLPSISINGIPGTWSPAVISTAATGTTTYTFTPATGQCATTASLSVVVTQPLAFAGVPETICPGNPFTLSAATAQDYSSLHWTTSGNGTFNDPTLLHPIYAAGANDIASGTVTLTLTAQGLGTAPGCVPAVSSVRLTILNLKAEISPTPQNISCFGANDGVIFVSNPSGGSGEYEFFRNGEANWIQHSDLPFRNVPKGNYTILMRDKNFPACIAILGSAEIFEPAQLSADVASNDASCLGNDGIISVTAPNGGWGNYRYKLNNGAWQSSGDFSKLVPGKYEVWIGDADYPDCVRSLGETEIKLPPPLTADVASKNVSCNGKNDGSINVSNPKGGSFVFELSIDGGKTWKPESGLPFTNLEPGVYVVQMRDYWSNECVNVVGTATITEPDPLTAKATPTNVTCFGYFDGKITITAASGGYGKYEYSVNNQNWSNKTEITFLKPGTYTVTMRDADQPTCEASLGEYTIAEPPQLKATVNYDDITCNGAKNGKISVSNPQNGVGSYQYTIKQTTSGFTSTNTDGKFTGLAKGDYLVSIQDSRPCKQDLLTVTITEPELLTATTKHTDETCTGHDGTIAISEPKNSYSNLYEYSIGGIWISDKLTFTGLSSNTYTVRIRDANLSNSCERTLETIHIDAPIPLAATATSTNITCNGASDGTITVENQFGGSTRYEYTLDNDNNLANNIWQDSPAFTSVSPGTYEIWMRDKNAPNCKILVDKKTITEPAKLQATAVPVAVTCFGGSDGKITFSGASGGTETGTYEYSVDGTNWYKTQIENLQKGTYTVQMRDGKVPACVVPLPQVVIGQPERLTAKLTPIDVKCFGESTGEIHITEPKNGLGNESDYNYRINGGAWTSVSTFTGLVAGPYTVEIQDGLNNDCTATLTPTTISQPLEPLVAVGEPSHTNETGPGKNDGTITIVPPTGGTPPYQYSIDSGVTWSTTTYFTGLKPGSYTIMARDTNSCELTILPDQIIQPSGAIAASYTLTPITCFGRSDGKIEFKNPSGASGGNYQFNFDGSWRPTNQFVFNSLPTGLYTLRVRDADNPTNSSTIATITLNQPSAPVSATVIATGETALNANDGIITISNFAGGSGGYQYRLDGGSWIAAAGPTVEIKSLAPKIYTVDIQDKNGCPETYYPVDVSEFTIEGVTATINPVQTCRGASSGMIGIANVSGGLGTGKYTYRYRLVGNPVWISAQYDPVKTEIKGLAKGMYELEVTDDNAGSVPYRKQFDIVEFPEPKVSLSADPIACFGGDTYVNFNITGGTEPYKKYFNGFEISSFVPKAGTYDFTIVDANGCSVPAHIDIPQPAEIIMIVKGNNPKNCGERGSIDFTFTNVPNGNYTISYNDGANNLSRNVSVVAGKASWLLLPTGRYENMKILVKGCYSKETTVIISDPSAPVYAVQSSNPTICTGKDGSILVTGLNTNTTYSVSKNNGTTYTNTTSSADGKITIGSLAAGIYDVVLKFNGCTGETKHVVLSDPPTPTLAAMATNPAVCGDNGTIRFTFTNVPNGTYTITYNDGTVDRAFNNVTVVANGATVSVTAGTYTNLRIKLNGCESNAVGPLKITDTLGAPVPFAVALKLPTCNDPKGIVEVTTPLGSQYQYSLDGIKYSNSPVFADVAPGKYVVWVKDILTLCVAKGNEVDNSLPPVSVDLVAVVIHQPDCEVLTGAIAVNQPAAGSGFTYRIDGGTWTSSVTFTGLLPGTHSVTIKETSTGCESQPQPLMIDPIPSVPEVPIASVTQQPTCLVAGIIEITKPEVGTGFEYSIDDGATWTSSVKFTDLEPGKTYSIRVKDSATKCVSLPLDLKVNDIPAAPEAPLASVSLQPSCKAPSGEIVVNKPAVGTGFEYSIDGGAHWTSSTTFGGLNPGTYSITVKEISTGCISLPSAAQLVNEVPEAPKAPVAHVVPGFPNCDTPLGIIEVTSPGILPSGYKYSLNGNKRTDFIFTGLVPGNYSLRLIDPTGCESPDILLVVPGVPESPAFKANLINPDCIIRTGTISVTVTNRVIGQNYRYSKNGGSTWQNGNEFTGLNPGPYSIAVLNVTTSCSSTVSVTIPPAPIIPVAPELTAVQPSCDTAAGIIAVKPVAGYTYSINGETPTSSTTFGNLIPGDYKVIAISGGGCTSTESKITIMPHASSPAVPTVEAIQTTCTLDTGTIQVRPPVVSGVYQYSIDGLTYQDNPTFTGLMPGTYTITVKNSEGCISGAFIQIIDEQPPTPSVPSMSYIQPNCQVETGTIIINSPTGAGYTYSVLGIATYTESTTFSGLSPGTYTVTVMNSDGCIATATQTIDGIPSQPAVPVYSLTKPNCKPNQNGLIKVLPPSGTDYLYSLDGVTFTTTTTFIDVHVGTYTLTVLDSTSSCTNTVSIPVVKETDPPVPELAVSPPNCVPYVGAITVTSPIQAETYEYSIDGGANYSTVTTFSGLIPGNTYTVTVRNILTDCISLAAATVTTTTPTSPATPLLALTATPTCLNEDGALLVTNPTGAEYAYKISGQIYLTGGKTQTSTTFSNLKTDTYTVTVINTLSGCESLPSTKDVPAVPPSPVITAISKVDPKCYGDTYTITISVPPVVSAGKTYVFDGIYTFNFNANEKFENDVTILNGTATITGILTESKTFNNIRFKANGCLSTGLNTNVSIKVPEPILITAEQITEQPLKGTQKGEINLTVKGGAPTLSYLWTSDTFSGTTTTKISSLSNLWAGNYTVTIIDSNNCSIQKKYQVPSNLPPLAVPDNYKYNCYALHENLLLNDSDPENDQIIINTTPVVSPKHAKNFRINFDGSFDYEVAPGFTGTEIFVYEIADKYTQTATASVTIIIAADFDGDGIADSDDFDADGDGILNVDEALSGQNWKIADYDGDGHPNWLDIDSDNDGIVDNIEAQSTADYIAPTGTVNIHGVDDAYNPDKGGVKLIPVNTDANLYMPDNQSDFLDADSDNDQVPDYIEGHDADSDGKVDPGHSIAGKDSDEDGLDDAWDTIVNGCNNFNATGSNAFIQDFDGDGIRDWRDDNDDDDEYLTRLEDLNADGDFSNDVTGHVGHPEYLWFGRDCSLFIPDAFSPNDDNVHDYFQIYCIEQYPNAKMYIFDQQGNKLFEKDHYGNVDFWGSHERAWWDGTTSNRIAAVNGRKVVPGTYYYVLKLGNGETKKSFVFVSY